MTKENDCNNNSPLPGISRRNFIKLAVAGLLVGCSPQPQLTATSAPTPTTTPTPTTVPSATPASTDAPTSEPTPVGTIQPDDNILITTNEFKGVIFHDRDWAPTVEEVRTLEKQLATYLPQQQHAFDGSKIPIEERLPTYKRQYWGILKNEKRVIFVNFFCNSLHYDWTYQEVVVDDGGDCYFQIRYDVETGTFFDLYVNGSA